MSGRTGRKTVLVLGMTSRAAQASARSLVRGGFRVVGASEGGRLAGRTRYCDRLVRVPPARETEALATAVREICDREHVCAILPMFDELQAVLLLHTEAGGEAIVVGPSLDELRRLCDKIGFLETATAAGVHCPATSVVDADRLSADLPPLPGYVKVVTSMYHGRPAGRPTRVTDAAVREDLLAELTKGGDTVVVQEEINGRQWRYDFLRCRYSTLAVASQQLSDWPYRVGQSTVLQYREMPAQLEALSGRLLDEVGYVGAGSIQFIERDGEWFAHDVNLRMPASVAGMIAAGFDLPRLTVEAALGHEPEPVRLPVRQVHYIWFQGEALALRDTVAGAPSGRGSAAIVGSLLLGALSPRRRLVPFDLTDPLPTLAAVSAVVRRPRSPSVA